MIDLKERFLVNRMTKLNTTELLQHVTDLFDNYGVPYEVQKNTGLSASHTNPTEILSDLIDIYPVGAYEWEAYYKKQQANGYFGTYRLAHSLNPNSETEAQAFLNDLKTYLNQAQQLAQEA